MRHFLTLLDLSAAELRELLAEAARLKEASERGERPAYLAGRVLGLVFEKPSLRTRASFEAAMAQIWFASGLCLIAGFAAAVGLVLVRRPAAALAAIGAGFVFAFVAAARFVATRTT